MKSALKVLIFIIILGTVSGGLLVGVNTYTAPLISRNEEHKLKSSVLDVFEIAYDKAYVISIFDGRVRVLKKGNETFYTASDGSVAFEFRGPGLWGPIAGIVSFEKDLKTIRNLKILHQEETPGLGGRIAEDGYLRQFKGKEALPELVFLPEGKARDINEVDSITGATGSSKALEKLINKNIQRYISILRE